MFADQSDLPTVAGQVVKLSARIAELERENWALATIIKDARKCYPVDRIVRITEILDSTPATALAAHDSTLRKQAAREIVALLCEQGLEIYTLSIRVRFGLDEEEK